jgi:hypothetical protein
MKFSLPEIRHNKEGFEALVRLQAQTKDCLFDDIDIDMGEAHWFDADMCAPFGAILYGLGESPNSIKLTNIHPTVETILSKNGFMSNYGREKVPDRWGTTIPYQRFDVKDDRYFASYIETKLIQRSEIPAMSPGLLKKFRESIFEIFSNAVLHSRTKMGIFSCGQFFPKRNKIDFSVTDLGIGIRQNVKENEYLDLDPENAIVWATEGCNTTKRGQIPGGLGLKLLCEFIDLNHGCIQIVSDAGYWRRENGNIVIARLSYVFPGTIVNLEINTADTQSYVLSTKMSKTNIF